MKNWLWIFLFVAGCQGQSDSVVTIYCAHDRAHAEQILDLFEKETGIRVEAIYDTEASKTVGLAERLRAEKERPRCDVHWSMNHCDRFAWQARGSTEVCRKVSLPESLQNGEIRKIAGVDLQEG